MMSAPSWASRIACERPWPRAAPVMKATLPATCPSLSRVVLSDRVACVDGDLQAGDVPGLVGGQEQDRVTDVPRVDRFDGEGVQVDRAQVRVRLDEVVG